MDTTSFAFARRGDTLTVQLGARLGIENRQELKSRIVELLGDGTRRVRICFAADHATFVDSSGWGVLVGLARRAQEAGARLVLVNVDAGNLDYLALTRLDAFFSQEAEEPDRLAA